MSNKTILDMPGPDYGAMLACAIFHLTENAIRDADRVIAYGQPKEVDNIWHEWRESVYRLCNSSLLALEDTIRRYREIEMSRFRSQVFDGTLPIFIPRDKKDA